MEAFWELVQAFGLPLAMLIVAIVTGAARVWVYGWYAKELKAENTELKAEVKEMRAVTKTAADNSNRSFQLLMGVLQEHPTLLQQALDPDHSEEATVKPSRRPRS